METTQGPGNINVKNRVKDYLLKRPLFFQQVGHPICFAFALYYKRKSTLKKRTGGGVAFS